MKIKTHIIDDSIDDIKKIQDILDISDIDFVYKSYTEFNRSIINSNVDLYILDIDMPDISGFDLAKKLYRNNNNPCIIFCSNHDNLVYESLMLNPFYFVRKNHLNDDFNMAFNKLKHSYNYKYANYISDNIDILLSRILFFEIDRNNLKIFLNNGEIIEERKTMKKLLNEFENNEHFLLVHNSFLVNMNYISNFSKNIIYIDSYEIPISRSKYTLANKKYITYKMRNDL